MPDSLATPGAWPGCLSASAARRHARVRAGSTTSSTQAASAGRAQAQRNLRLLLPFGHGAPATSPELAGNRALAPAAATLPADLPARGHVVLHPFSMGHGREWPLQHWVELARLLTAQDVPVVFTGSADERDRLAQAWPPAQRPPGVLDAGGRLDIGQLSVLLHGASAMTACGTGPLHLAAALGTPALGLYPPRKGVALDRWAPLGRAAVGVQAYRCCPHGRRCENAACRCMAALAPQRVAQALHPLARHTLNIGPLAPWMVAAPGVSAPRSLNALLPGDTT